ncbi:MAG: hypothetical protein IJP38_02140 [Oscillospiraceae bacterium]|nr:hypothetical protein [Oscillospiraceae bacterium]
MKKSLSLFLVALMLFALSACESSQKDFDALRERVSAAGYTVSDAYVDASFEGVVTAFAVKVNFDANTVATIPIILTKSESAAKKNCEMFGEDSIKQPIQNGKIFSYPGKDYPEDVLNLVHAIVNGEDIPLNPSAE